MITHDSLFANCYQLFIYIYIYIYIVSPGPARDVRTLVAREPRGSQGRGFEHRST